MTEGEKPCWLSWHRNYPSRFTIHNEILQSGMPYFPSYVHLKPLSHLTFSHHEHKRLIMMLFLKRFTADCSSFSRMKDLRWVHLLVKLSLLQEWDQHGSLLWQNLSMFWQPPRDGVCISSRMSPWKHLLFFMIRVGENSYSHICECYFVLLVHLHSNIDQTPRSQQKLSYWNLIFMLAWFSCQTNLNVLIFLTRFLSSTLFSRHSNFSPYSPLLMYKMFLNSSL